eukprot:TCALIF_04451-PA protein Name:"Similar to CHIA Acidic mammalian chitinase (Bos taurus)" AED:0.30 eAED:0.30 QI:0/0.73/0.65/0.9/0.89/0.85/20/288/2866
MLMRSKEIIVAILWMISLAQTAEHSVQKRQIGSPGQRVVCYFANWAVYRQGTAKFTPQNINPYLCTHLIYAFGGLTKDDTIQPFDKYQDIEKGGYSQLAALKTYNRELKTLLAIGGWNEGSKRFSPMVADPARRRSFIKSAIRFARQYNFDGIDLDWEYPSFRDGGKPEDRVNYAKLIIEMREAFDLESEQTGKERLLITMAVPASLEYAGKGFDIKTLNKHLDFFNFLTYDYHSSYEPSVNHHSPLFRPKDVSEYDFRADLNVDATVKFYIKNGASRDKLVLGIPTYGRSYTLVNPDAHQIGSPTDGPGEQGKGTKEDGYLAYYEICEGVKQKNWTVERPNPGLVGPYAHNDDFWVGYDDINAVMDKAIYVSEEGLGGIMFWTIDNDDFRGACHDKPFPLIESAKEALFGKVNSQVKTSVSVSTSEQTRVERVKLTPKQLEDMASQSESEKDFRTPLTPRPRSLPSGVTIDPFNTPSPPTTPSNEPAFECKSEGFFPHKSICKKYYWCLEAAGLGMVAHTFTCPGGLYFNVLTDGCDFKRNVDCAEKDAGQDSPSASTTTATPQSAEDDSEEDPQSLKDILSSIKAAGGLEAFENQLRKEEEHKEELIEQEQTRKTDISSQTRNRLNQLLERKRAESNKKLEGGQDDKEEEQTQASRPDTNPNLSSDSDSEPEQEPSQKPSVASTTEQERTTTRSSLLGRLANRRLNSGGSDRLRRLRERFQAKEKTETPNLDEDQDEPQIDSASPATQSDTTTARSRLFRNRPRFGLNRGQSLVNSVATTPKARTVLRGRDRFRNLIARPSLPSASTTPTTTSTEAESSNDNENIGESKSEDDTTASTLRPNRFRPKSGTRDRLRSILHESLEEEKDAEETNGDGEETQFVASNKQRVPPVFNDEPEASLRPKSRFQPEYVELNRGPVPKPRELEEAISSSLPPTVAPLEYVTLSRGSSQPNDVDAVGNNLSETDEDTLGSPRTGLESQFITPLPFDAAIREDDEEGADDIPLRAVTPEPTRNLEYVTLRRGQEAAANTVPDSSDEVISNQVGDSQVRLGPPRISLRVRPRHVRSAEIDAPVSIIFPTLNSRTLNDANVIPDLPVQKDVSYIFPFSPGFKRDHRQTSPNVDPSTTPNNETPITVTTLPTTTIGSKSKETVSMADIDVVSDEEDFNEEDYEVSVSVSKSVSETFSVLNPPEDESESIENSDNAEETLQDSQVSEHPETTTELSDFGIDETTSIPSTTTTTSVIEPETTRMTTTSTEVPTPETTTSRFQSLLRNRKKPALAPKLHSILSPNTQTDSKTPKSLGNKDRQHPFFKQRSSLFGPPTTEASTTVETTAEDGEDQDKSDEIEELEGSGTEPTTEADLDLETTTKGNFFAQKIQERLLKAAEEKKPVISGGNKFGILGNRKTRPKFILPSSFKQRIQQQESEENRENSIEKEAADNEIPDEDNQVIDDDETVSKVSRGESTTFAPTTTTQLTVADILAELNGDTKKDDKPATLRPRSFKPKFGSRQRDKLREKLKEQLVSEDNELEPKEIRFDIDEEENKEISQTSAEGFKPTSTGSRRTISRPRSRLSSRPIPEKLRSSSNPINTISRPRNALRSRSRPRVSQPLPTLRQEPFVTTTSPFELEPLTVTELEETTTETQLSGRQLSDADIMSGLGLTPEVFNDVEDTDEIPELEEYSEDMEALIEEPESVSKSNDPNDFLLQLVHDNQKHANEGIHSAEGGETGSLATPIMQNPSLLVTPMDTQTETTIPDVPLVFNPEQLLKSAIVESKLPPQITAKPRRPNHRQQQQQLQRQFQQQEQEEKLEYDDFTFENDYAPEPLEEQIAFRPRPAPRPAPRPVPRRLPARTQNRFIPPNSPSSTPDLSTEASIPKIPQRVVSNRRQRIRNRGRTPIRQSDNEIDVNPTIKEENVPEEKISVAIPRRPSPPRGTRGRVPVRSRARLIRPNQAQSTESEPESVDDVKEPQEISPKAQLVTRRGNSRPKTRGRSRLRVVSRSQVPVSDEIEQDNGETDQEEVQNSELPSEAVNEAERSAPSRSRIRIRGKLDNTPPQLELTTPTNRLVNHEDHMHNAQVPSTEAITTTIATTTSIVPSEEPPITTHRPITLTPLFGAKTVRQDELGATTQGRHLTTSSTTSASLEQPSTEADLKETSPFKSVSKLSGLRRIPAGFFTTPSPHFSSFPPRDFDDDVEAELSTRRSFARVERSTLGPIVLVTTSDYLRRGVSGHSFQDVSIMTSTQPSTPEVEEVTKEETSEETTKRPKPKLIKKSKIKIKKSLFGRKRPNFLKALEKTIIEEKDQDRKAGNLLFGRTTDDESLGNNTNKIERPTEQEASETDKESSETDQESSTDNETSIPETTEYVTSSPTESSPIDLLKSINVTPRSSYDRDSFRRPRRRLDLNGLKSLYSKKNSLSPPRLSPLLTGITPVTVLSTTKPAPPGSFIPTQTTTESSHLTGDPQNPPARASPPSFLRRKLKKSLSSPSSSTSNSSSTSTSSSFSNTTTTTTTTTTETSSIPNASNATTTPNPPSSSESQGAISTPATEEAPVDPVNDNPTAAPESFSNVDKGSSLSNRRNPLRSRPFVPRASIPRFSFPTRNTTPNPPRRSSLLILSNPSPTPSFEDSFTFSIASSTPASPQREEPRKIEISEPSFPSSVAPSRNLGPRPEEQLFQQVSQQPQFEDLNVEPAFESRFEESPSPIFTIVDGTRDRPEGPIVATAVPLISRPTVRPNVKPLARSPSPTRRRRPSVVTTPKPPAEYEYYYEYYYDEDEADANVLPESRSKPVPSIDDYDLQPLTNKVEILPSGRTLCHDVGVFPHPHSCRKFVMCSRRATRDGITGWEYECPIYLAFDPVGGRCNWATDVVCS